MKCCVEEESEHINYEEFLMLDGELIDPDNKRNVSSENLYHVAPYFSFSSVKCLIVISGL